VPRYAVLHDVTARDSAPVGLAIEMPDHVLVHVPREYGIHERHDGEYRVLQPNMTHVVYAPGDAAFFDQVLVDLSWAFGVGEQGLVESANYQTLFQLLVEKVERERNREKVGDYETVGAPRERRAVTASHAYQPVEVEAPTEDYLAVAARAGVCV
jgi:hypothetical protein